MVPAGDENASLVAEAGREGVEGTVSGGFCDPVHNGALVLVEQGAKEQCGLRIALDAAPKPVQQGLQVLPRVLGVWMQVTTES